MSEIEHFDDACVAVGVSVLEHFAEGDSSVIVVRNDKGGWTVRSGDYFEEDAAELKEQPWVYYMFTEDRGDHRMLEVRRKRSWRSLHQREVMVLTTEAVADMVWPGEDERITTIERERDDLRILLRAAFEREVDWKPTNAEFEQWCRDLLSDVPEDAGGEDG